jgi:hypothetical protein
VIQQQFECLVGWRAVAGDVHGHPLDRGHYPPEEQPVQTARELEDFLR